MREMPAVQVSVYRWERATAEPLLRLRFDDLASELHLQADCLAVLAAGAAAGGALTVCCASLSYGVLPKGPRHRAPAVSTISSTGSGLATMMWALLALCSH